MTMTVISPSGTPTLVYNRDGVTIDSLTAAPSGDPPAAIIRYSSVTVVLVTASANTDSVILPADAEIGDVVEVYFQGSVAHVQPDSGSQINGNGADVPTNNTLAAIFRKVNSTNWYGPLVA